MELKALHLKISIYKCIYIYTDKIKYKWKGMEAR